MAAAGPLPRFQHGEFDLQRAWDLDKKTVQDHILAAPKICDGNEVGLDDVRKVVASLEIKLNASSVTEKAMRNQPPLEVRFMGVTLRLHSASQELAFVMSLICKANPQDEPKLHNFYAFVAALYHQWHYTLWPNLTQKAPWMSSIAIYKARDSGLVPLITGNSLFGGKGKDGTKKAQQKELEALGLIMDEPSGNYGNCAETDHWIVSKKLNEKTPGEGKFESGLAVRKQIIDIKNRPRLANLDFEALAEPCKTCQHLAKKAGYSVDDIEKRFGIDDLKKNVKALQQTLGTQQGGSTPGPPTKSGAAMETVHAAGKGLLQAGAEALGGVVTSTPSSTKTKTSQSKSRPSSTSGSRRGSKSGANGSKAEAKVPSAAAAAAATTASQSTPSRRNSRKNSKSGVNESKAEAKVSSSANVGTSRPSAQASTKPPPAPASAKPPPAIAKPASLPKTKVNQPGSTAITSKTPPKKS